MIETILRTTEDVEQDQTARNCKLILLYAKFIYGSGEQDERLKYIAVNQYFQCFDYSFTLNIANTIDRFL